MACTIQQSWNPGLLRGTEEEEWRSHLKKSQHRSYGLLWKEYFEDRSQWLDNHTSKAGPAYLDFKHRVTKEALWIYGWNNPSWVSEGLRTRGLAVSAHAEHGVQCEKNKYEDAPLHHDECMDFVAVLRTCAKRKDLYAGSRVHDDILKRGQVAQCSDELVTMYAKCGALAKAKELLDIHKIRNTFPWTALIAGYARHGQGRDALNCFDQMQHRGIPPDALTYACALKACGSIKAVDRGKQIHDDIVRKGLLEKSIVLGNALVNMYAKCGALMKACSVFDKLPSRDVVSWNTIIAGYAQMGQGEQALNCFEQMQREGLFPNTVTFTCILKACGTIGAVEKGEQIRDQIARQGLLGNNIMLGNALVDMYAKCGALAKAQQVLEELPSRDVVSWNALITGYAQQGQGDQALRCFERMHHDGLSPDAVTFSCILNACGTMGVAEKGQQIHDEIVRQGLLGNNIVLGNALVSMYVKCGALSKAQQVLEELPARDVVSWSALIAGYVQHGRAKQALSCYERMQWEGLSPNAVTFTCILKACGIVGAIDKGEQIHDKIARQGFLASNIVLGTALVDMYAKCGALANAQRVLEELPSRNVVSWSALITGYAQQGEGEKALICFKRMLCEGICPNAVTFSSVLNVCSHLGLVEEGYMYFVNMSSKYGIERDLEHYTCMVDLFGRAGLLDKAVGVIQEMPSSDYSAVWFALLSACQRWGDVNVGRWAFDQVLQIEKGDAVAYVLMANIYSAADMQGEAENIEAMRMEYKA